MTARDDAAQVLTSHQPWRDAYGQYVCIDSDACAFVGTESEHRHHQADALAAAGLLATPEHDAQVAAGAWDEGRAATREGDVCGDPACCPPPDPNPYERQEGEGRATPMRAPGHD